MNVAGFRTRTFSPAMSPSLMSALKLGSGRRKPMAADDFVRRHEADIVSVVFVFRSRITETHNQSHSVMVRLREA